MTPTTEEVSPVPVRLRGRVCVPGAVSQAGSVGQGPGEDVVDSPHPPGLAIREIRQVMATLTALIRSAVEEILIFDDPGGGLGRGIPETFLDFAEVPVRSVDETEVAVRRIVPRDGPAAVPYHVPRQFPGLARQTESIPFKMIVVDRTVAAVPLDLLLHYNGLLLIRDPVVVRALVRIHESAWESGEDLYASPDPAPGVVPEHLRLVLEALAAGLTDEAAAARLSMSSRTYSRRIGALLAALGTPSRFRAGVEAARRGWI
jgi:hypothetical protein